MVLTDEERVIISKEWHLVTHPTWHVGTRAPDPHEVGYVVTDACDNGYALIVFTRDGRILSSNSGQLKFDAKMLARCIYYKELRCINRGNSEAMDMLHRINHVETHMISVPSKHNGSDTDSRGWPWDETRLATHSPGSSTRRSRSAQQD